MLNYGMGYNKDLENAVRRIFVEAYPTGKDNPLNTVYEPTDTISDETWKKMRHGYLIPFFIMPNINENAVGKWLDSLWGNWNRGGYKCSEDFINKVDELMENLRMVQASRNKLTFMDEALYDELFEGFEHVMNQRTWDDSITDKMLKDKAIEIQTDIEIYFKKRVEHNFDITDKMNSFKGVEDLTDATTERITSFMKKANEVFEEEESKPTLPEDKVSKTKEKYSVRYKTPEEPPVQKGDGELASAHNLIKRQKKKIQALRLRKKKPTSEMEMIELINRNLKKNGKCNNEACGRELEVDGETIKRWIAEFQLTRYATNPKHRK